MINILVIALLLILYAMLCATRAAFLSVNKLKIELDIIQKRRYAIISKKLLEERERVISSISVVKAVVLIFSIILSVSLFSNIIDSVTNHYWFASLITILSVFVLITVVGILLPLYIAVKNPDRVFEYLYWVAHISYIVVNPFIPAAHKIDKERASQDKSSEAEIFHNALNFQEVVLRECMVPRTEIASIEESESRESLIKLFAETKYSRIIVYKDSIDNIVGYIHTKDLFGEYESIKDIMRTIESVSEEDLAKSLLKKMIKNKQSISVVLDKYGGTAGIVTMEDIIEEIFGEISDELDMPELVAKKISDREYIFSGRFEIKHLNREYSLGLPESDDYETLAGMLVYHNENIPKEGEVLKIEGYKFKILKSAKNRIESIVLTVDE